MSSPPSINAMRNAPRRFSADPAIALSAGIAAVSSVRDPNVSAVEATSVDIGSNGRTVGALERTGKTQCGELDAQAKIALRFNEASTNSRKRAPENRSHGIALSVDLANDVNVDGATDTREETQSRLAGARFIACFDGGVSPPTIIRKRLKTTLKEAYAPPTGFPAGKSRARGRRPGSELTDAGAASAAQAGLWCNASGRKRRR